MSSANGFPNRGKCQLEVRPSTSRCVRRSNIARRFLTCSLRRSERVYHFNARFFDEIRHVGTPQARCKIRLIAQAYKYNTHGLLTYAPNLQRSSQRIILHFTAYDMEHLILLLRYIVQAYTKTNENLKLILYLRPL